MWIGEYNGESVVYYAHPVRDPKRHRCWKAVPAMRVEAVARRLGEINAAYDRLSSQLLTARSERQSAEKAADDARKDATRSALEKEEADLRTQRKASEDGQTISRLRAEVDRLSITVHRTWEAIGGKPADDADEEVRQLPDAVRVSLDYERDKVGDAIERVKQLDAHVLAVAWALWPKESENFEQGGLEPDDQVQRIGELRGQIDAAKERATEADRVRAEDYAESVRLRSEIAKQRDEAQHERDARVPRSRLEAVEREMAELREKHEKDTERAREHIEKVENERDGGKHQIAYWKERKEAAFAAANAAETALAAARAMLRSVEWGGGGGTETDEGFHTGPDACPECGGLKLDQPTHHYSNHPEDAYPRGHQVGCALAAALADLPPVAPAPVAKADAPPRTAAVSLVERGDGRVLVVWNRRYGGWSLPGGLVEGSESTIAAQARELREETGLETVSVKLVFDGSHGLPPQVNGADRASHVALFRVRVTGHPREVEPGCPVTWLTREEFLRWSPFAAFYRGIFEREPFDPSWANTTLGEARKLKSNAAAAPSSSQIVMEFIRGRGRLYEEVKRIANDGFKAPEAIPALISELTSHAMRKVNAAEQASLDRIRGNGNVDWSEVAAAFRVSQ